MPKKSNAEVNEKAKAVLAEDLPVEKAAELSARIKDSINIEPGAVHDFFSCHAHFVKDEWRPVPAGFEEEARAHPFLETK
jgi:hypothetical protein